MLGAHFTNFTSCECPDNTAWHEKSSSSSLSHIHIVLSLLHVAIKVPSKLKSIDLTSFSWPSKGLTGSKSSSSYYQTTAVASKEADAKQSFPYGLVLFHFTYRIVLECVPSRVVLQTPSSTDQIFIVLSDEQVARSFPSALKSSDQTRSVWPNKLKTNSIYQ